MNFRRPLLLLALVPAPLLLTAVLPSIRKPAEGNLAAANDGLSESSAQAFLRKFQSLSASPSASSDLLSPVVVTDREANSYLKFYGRDFLPAGVYRPIVHIEPGGIQGVAVVNFDQLNRAEPQDDPLGAGLLGVLFKGWQPVRAFGRIATSPEKAKVTIENVKIGETLLNDWLVNWLLQTYVESKYKIDLSQPLKLPPRVTRLTLEPGKAIFERGAVAR